MNIDKVVKAVKDCATPFCDYGGEPDEFWGVDWDEEAQALSIGMDPAMLG